jgi:ABC-type multidrug transport system fused ATPase/permease subunit
VEGKKIEGGIRFREVEMRYGKKLRPALSGLSFEIKRGEKVSVVGRTGSGKSSLF